MSKIVECCGCGKATNSDEYRLIRIEKSSENIRKFCIERKSYLCPGCYRVFLNSIEGIRWMIPFSEGYSHGYLFEDEM